MTKSSQLTLFRILLVLYMAGLAFLCFGNFGTLPTTPSSLLDIPVDKLVHACMFFPFPFLAFLSFPHAQPSARKTLLFVGGTLLVGMLVGVGTEWGQAAFTDYRVGEVSDFLADTVGLFIGGAFVALWDIRRQRKG